MRDEVRPLLRTTCVLAAAIFASLAGATSAQSENPLLPGPQPPDVSLEWKQLVGIYERQGTKDSFTLLERGQRLFWSDSHHVSHEALSKSGLLLLDGRGGPYVGFTEERNSSGAVTALSYLNEIYVRTDAGSDPSHTYHVTPSRPVEELRREALAATLPKEAGNFRKPDLVELTPLDAGIHLDIRYATTNDFLGSPVYSQARAFLQRPAAEALLRVQQKLKPLGYGLLIHDAYRPWYVTKIFWDATPPEGKIFVADPAQGSRHNRGCAVDLTLYDLATGKPIEMPGTYDEMSPRSFPDYPGGTSLQRWHRDLLRRAMESEGFTVYEAEWWHFDYKDWKEYPILNVPFEKLGLDAGAGAVH